MNHLFILLFQASEGRSPAYYFGYFVGKFLIPMVFIGFIVFLIVLIRRKMKK